MLFVVNKEYCLLRSKTRSGISEIIHRTIHYMHIFSYTGSNGAWGTQGTRWPTLRDANQPTIHISGQEEKTGVPRGSLQSTGGTCVYNFTHRESNAKSNARTRESNAKLQRYKTLPPNQESMEAKVCVF